MCGNDASLRITNGADASFLGLGQQEFLEVVLHIPRAGDDERLDLVKVHVSNHSLWAKRRPAASQVFLKGAGPCPDVAWAPTSYTSWKKRFTPLV